MLHNNFVNKVCVYGGGDGVREGMFPNNFVEVC